MRTNLPIFDIEYHPKEGEVFVSKTDIKGFITYCNLAFCDASGFFESELLGQSHNIVRHPDMPPEIFADCWETIRSGNPWHGIIKNRRKNGDYYWVDANITPLFENGELTGYLSLRYKPSARQVAQAEKNYSAVRAGTSSTLFSHEPDKNYIGQLQRRLAEKIVAQEAENERVEQEQKIAARYMNKLIAADKLHDSAVQFYLKPAENFSGDIIAIARTPDNRLHLLLADSTGHGLSAALAAMPMIHPFYSMTSKGFTISAIAQEINKKVWQSLPVSHFVAAIIVSIDAVSHMIEVWSGGCPPPFMLNNEGEREHQFKPRHLAMGILPPKQFDSSVEYFAYENNSSSLVMFSDGVIELENSNGEQFGLDRLLNSVRVADATTRWERTLREIETYCGGKTSGNDDIALMMVQCEFGTALGKPVLSKEQKAQEEIEGRVLWQFALTLTMHQIKKLDVVPLLLDIVQQIEKDKERSGEIFMILSEIFNNALDHGVLKLDSSLKHHEDGLEKYFDERAARLANTETGHVQLNLEKILNTDGTAFLRILVSDSGEGFDYQRVVENIATSSQRHGRGISLLHHVCRTVQYLNGGSEILVEFDLPDADNKLVQSRDTRGN
jgi:PAS domain S-box-containing protein